MQNDGKKTMTLNLTDREMQAVEELAQRKDLTKTSVIRQALRLYQLLDARIAKGEKILFEDVTGAKQTEIMLL